MADPEKVQSLSRGAGGAVPVWSILEAFYPHFPRQASHPGFRLLGHLNYPTVNLALVNLIMFIFSFEEG
jgi:hypothetical protein